MIEIVYLLTGLLLPLFYIPQILKLRKDQSFLASYSLTKSSAQLLLRLPALAFALLVVQNGSMNVVLTADVLGRLVELSFAVWSLRRQEGISSHAPVQAVKLEEVAKQDSALNERQDNKYHR